MVIDFDKGIETIWWGHVTIFSTNGFGATGYPCEKEWSWKQKSEVGKKEWSLIPTSYHTQKLTQKWTIEQTIKL